MEKKWCILGNDARSDYIRKMYKEEGKKYLNYDMSGVIVAPIHFSRDNLNVNGENIKCDDIISNMANKAKVLYTGAISKIMKSKLEENHVKFYDVFENEDLAILNAIPTAEGAIKTAIEMTNFTINGSNVLVLGYGKIGKVLSKMLNGIGAKVFCEARNKKDIAFIQAMGYNSVELKNLDNVLNGMDVIFNTIPSMILDESRLKRIKKECAIIDLASNPGGVDFLKAKELELNVTWALALPGKVAPYTSALYVKNIIDEIDKEG